MTHRDIIPQRAPMMWGARTKGHIVKPDFSENGFFGRMSAPKYLSQGLEFLGSGRFTNAFRMIADPKQVLLFTFWEDFSKSIMAHAFNERLASLSNFRLKYTVRWGLWNYKGKGCNVYCTKYVSPFNERPRNAGLRKLVETLQEIHDNVRTDFAWDIVKTNKCDEFNAAVIKECWQHSIVPDSFTYTLEVLRNVAQDWGDHYIFDNFHAKNLGVYKRELYMIDPMFDLDKIQKDYEARKRRNVTVSIADIDYMS